MAIEFYKCDVCGNIVVKPVDSGIDVECCGSEMDLLVANTEDAATEKHVPQVTVDGAAVHVEVGSVLHPMTPEHQICFIALETAKGYQIVKLAPTDEPKADFAVAAGDSPVAVYEYCNLHGLWSAAL